MIKALAEIENIEKNQLQITNSYKENLGELGDVSKQQNVLLDELKSIEGELDKMLPEYTSNSNGNADGDNSKGSRLAHMVIKNPATAQVPSRERVFEQALALEESIDVVKRDLNEVGSQLSD